MKSGKKEKDKNDKKKTKQKIRKNFGEKNMRK